jgi:hypothetical protein
LITIRQMGRERYCEARLSQLKEVSDWAEQYKEFWTRRLDALEGFLMNEKKKPKKGKR